VGREEGDWGRGEMVGGGGGGGGGDTAGSEGSCVSCFGTAHDAHILECSHFRGCQQPLKSVRIAFPFCLHLHLKQRLAERFAVECN